MSKKFDICISAPRFLQQKHILDKVIELGKTNVTVLNTNMVNFPTSKTNDRYADIFNKYLIDCEELDKDFCDKNRLGSIGVCLLDSNKKDTDNIHIKYKYFKDREITVNNIYNIKKYDKIDEEIINYLKSNNREMYYNFINIHQVKSKSINDTLNKFFKKSYRQNKVYLTVNAVTTRFNFISGNNGKIFKNKEEFEKDYILRKAPFINVFIFNTIKEAENCRESLKRNLFKYILLISQSNRTLTANIFDLLPNIDWSNNKSKTDKGILELCNCPQNKIDNYINYINSFVEKNKNKTLAI